RSFAKPAAEKTCPTAKWNAALDALPPPETGLASNWLESVPASSSHVASAGEKLSLERKPFATIPHAPLPRLREAMVPNVLEPCTLTGPALAPVTTTGLATEACASIPGQKP